MNCNGAKINTSVSISSGIIFYSMAYEQHQFSLYSSLVLNIVISLNYIYFSVFGKSVLLKIVFCVAK